jgi:hypothetical protein
MLKARSAKHWSKCAALNVDGRQIAEKFARATENKQTKY